MTTIAFDQIIDLASPASPASPAPQAVEEEDEDTAKAVPAVTDPPAAPRLTRQAAIAALNAAFATWADQMILARKLTLGTDKVQSRELCSSGTAEFMTRGHLQPLTDRNRHPVQERPAEAEEAEERIRTWVRTKFDGAIEDYTATGLVKRVPKIQEQHKLWHTSFRDLIISKYRDSYITLERMQEVLPQLGMERYAPRVYASFSASLDWSVPLDDLPGESQADKQRLLKQHMMDALRVAMGPTASQERCSYPLSDRNVSLTLGNWRY